MLSLIHIYVTLRHISSIDCLIAVRTKAVRIGIRVIP